MVVGQKPVCIGQILRVDIVEALCVLVCNVFKEFTVSVLLDDIGYALAVYLSLALLVPSLS